MVSLKNAKTFLAFVVGLHWRVIMISTGSSLNRSLPRMKMVHNFAQYLLSQYKKKGADYVIAYLKASQLALSKFLAHEKVSSLMELNPDYIFPRLHNGLPKIIGPLDRAAIRRGDHNTIRLWMSLFGLYRVIAGTYKLKLSTILDDFSGESDKVPAMSLFFYGFTKKIMNGRVPKSDYREALLQA